MGRVKTCDDNTDHATMMMLVPPGHLPLLHESVIYYLLTMWLSHTAVGPLVIRAERLVRS